MMSSSLCPLLACFSLGKSCSDLAILPENFLIVLYFHVVFTDGLAGLVHVLKYHKYMVLSPTPCVVFHLLVPLSAPLLPSFAINLNIDDPPQLLGVAFPSFSG